MVQQIIEIIESCKSITLPFLRHIYKDIYIIVYKKESVNDLKILLYIIQDERNFRIGAG